MRHRSASVSSRCKQYGRLQESSGDADGVTATPQQQQQQHLVLIGGGHAHVQVIKALNAACRPNHLKVTLMDCNQSASYSGMVPGCIAGLYTHSETLVHLKPLADWADIVFVHDTVIDIDLETKQIWLLQQPDQPVSFDVISIDIGSTARGYDSCPGASDYAIPTRPIHQLISRLDEARLELLRRDQDNEKVEQKKQLVVIGGGAAGLELAMAVTSRWQKDQMVLAGTGTAVDDTVDVCTILDTGYQLLPSENALARETVQNVLQAKHIAVQYGCHVQRISHDAIHLLRKSSKQPGSGGDDTITVPHTHCIWATGAGAHHLAWHLAQKRGLDCDDNGWIRVQPTLQSSSHPFVFAAGDCASIQHLDKGPPPKAGVYAVRAGPILIENLTRYLDSIRFSDSTTAADASGEPTSTVKLQSYEPQDDFLKLLVCGDGTALGFRFGLAMQGKWVFDLKDNIDQSFMKLFDVSDLPKPIAGSNKNNNGSYDTRQYDATDPVPDLPEPDAAAILLQRTDDGVDFQVAKLVIRAMGNDVSYREAVLQCIHRSVEINVNV